LGVGLAVFWLITLQLKGIGIIVPYKKMVFDFKVNFIILGSRCGILGSKPILGAKPVMVGKGL